MGSYYFRTREGSGIPLYKGKPNPCQMPLNLSLHIFNKIYKSIQVFVRITP